MHTVGADELALDFGEEQGAQAALNATARVLAYTSSSAQNPESRPRYKNMFVEQLPKSSCLPAPPSLSQQGRSVAAPVHEGQLAPSITPDEALKKQTAPVVVFEGSGHAEVRNYLPETHIVVKKLVLSG